MMPEAIFLSDESRSFWPEKFLEMSLVFGIVNEKCSDLKKVLFVFYSE